MKVAVVGSRTINVSNLGEYLPIATEEILSGGAKGIDQCARDYAHRHMIPLREFLPDYHKFGRAAPLRRNDLILDHADFVLAFWDGRSHGTKYVIKQAQKRNIPLRIVFL